MLRPQGDAAIRARVEQLLISGDACWCPMIRLELWNGAQGDHEKRVLRDFERHLPELPINDAVWSEAFDLARRARARGITIPATDVLIAACARHHEVGLEHADQDFDRIAKLIA